MLSRTSVLLAGLLAASLLAFVGVATGATESPSIEKLAGVAPVSCADSAADWVATVDANDGDPAAWGFTSWTAGPTGIYLDPSTCRGLLMALADPSGASYELSVDWRWYVARGIAVLAHETGHVVFATWDETLAECYGVAHWRSLMLALGIPADVRGRSAYVAPQAPLAPVPTRLPAGVRDERTLWQLLLAFHRSGDPSMRSHRC